MVKTKINVNANINQNKSEMMFKNLKGVGVYTSRYLFGLPKNHKDITDTPLQAILSMSGTVTHDVDMYLNTLIRPFLHLRFCYIKCFCQKRHMLSSSFKHHSEVSL